MPPASKLALRLRRALALAAAAATFALQEWLYRKELSRLEDEEKRVRRELAKEAGQRIDVLLTKVTAEETTLKHSDELWGKPQGAAWCGGKRGSS
jgi:hypothetical protein